MGEANGRSQRSAEETIRFWQSFSDEDLTSEDVAEIVENSVAMLSLLMEWAAEDKRQVDSGQEGEGVPNENG